MDNKVIEVFDYLGEKLGIAIDWTENNIMPQITEFLCRYQVYGIAKCIAWIAISFVISLICILFVKKIVKDVRCENEKSFWYGAYNESYDGEAGVIAVGVIIAIVALVFIIVGICHIFSLIEWVTVPEMKFIDTFINYLNSQTPA